MKAILGGVINVFLQHLGLVVGLCFAAVLIILGSEQFIEEKSFTARLVSPVIGLFGGMAVGGVAGWLIGGIGIAAMGGAIGLSAPFVAMIGAIGFGVVGAFGGTSVALYRVLRNPSGYQINWFGIILLIVAASVCLIVIKNAIDWFLRRRAVSNIEE